MYTSLRGKVSLNPQWRWQRAMDLVTMDRPSLTPEDGRTIVRTYDFLRELNRAGPDHDKQRRVRSRYPHIYDGHILYREGGELRHGAEAMLLAGLTLKDIAEILRLEPGVVRAFRDLWFDVPIDEKERVRVLLSLVPEAYAEGFDPRDTDGFWKAIAGLKAPRRLLNVMTVLGPLNTERESLADVIREGLQRKALDGALGGGLDAKAIEAIVAVLTEAQEERHFGELPKAWQEAVYEAYRGFKWGMAVDREDGEAEKEADGPPDDAAEHRSEDPPADD